MKRLLLMGTALLSLPSYTIAMNHPSGNQNMNKDNASFAPASGGVAEIMSKIKDYATVTSLDNIQITMLNSERDQEEIRNIESNNTFYIDVGNYNDRAYITDTRLSDDAISYIMNNDIQPLLTSLLSASENVSTDPNLHSILIELEREEETTRTSVLQIALEHVQNRVDTLEILRENSHNPENIEDASPDTNKYLRHTIAMERLAKMKKWITESYHLPSAS